MREEEKAEFLSYSHSESNFPSTAEEVTLKEEWVFFCLATHLFETTNQSNVNERIVQQETPYSECTTVTRAHTQ